MIITHDIYKSASYTKMVNDKDFDKHKVDMHVLNIRVGAIPQLCFNCEGEDNISCHKVCNPDTATKLAVTKVEVMG